MKVKIIIIFHLITVKMAVTKKTNKGRFHDGILKNENRNPELHNFRNILEIVTIFV
jgi:hypothetical protein